MEKFQGLVDKLSRSLPDPLKGGGTVTRRRDAERMLSSSAEAILAVCPGPTGEKLQNEADRFRQKCDELVGDLFPEMLTRFEKEMVEFHAGKNCENFQAEVDIQSAVQISKVVIFFS